MGDQKKVIFIGEKIDLYNAFKRAFEFAKQATVLPYKGKLLSRNNVVLISFDCSFEAWYWGDFRGKRRALNPVVVVGTDVEDVFLEKYPVFVPYKGEHAYFSIPFDLDKLIKKALSLKPIFDQDTRKAMVRDFGQGYEWRLIDHDMKIIKGDKSSSLKNLLAINEFYKSKGDNEAVRLINARIKEMQTTPDWEQLLLRIRNTLIERYKARGKE